MKANPMVQIIILIIFLEKDSNNPLIYIYLGDAFTALNDKNMAKQNFSRIIELVEKKTNGRYTTTAFAKFASLFFYINDFNEQHRNNKR